MRRRRAIIPLFLLVLTLMSACSSTPIDEVSEREALDTRCGNYQIDRKSYTIDDGRPVVDGVKGMRVSHHCKFEIVQMYEYPETPGLKTPQPDLVGAPQELTDLMRVRDWIRIDKQDAAKDRYFVLPAYTFQCEINTSNDPGFQCPWESSTSHKLGVYTEEAFEISSGAMFHLDSVGLDFSASSGTRTGNVVETAQGGFGDLNKEYPAVWTTLLVLRKESFRTGLADVCIDTPAQTCHLVYARGIHTEDFVLARQTQAWNKVLRYFKPFVLQPEFVFSAPPELPPRHSDYKGGPRQQVLGGPVKGVKALWKNTDTVLQRQDRKAGIDIKLVTISAGVSHGEESEEVSSAEIKYELNPDKPGPDDRCLELLAVGGKAKEKPITGIILKEGCSN